MIVLHGMLGSSRNWLSTGRDLAEHWHVIALDARNHGKSPHDDVMNYDVLAEDIRAWMDARGLNQATVVGHSMGGKAAMRLACSHPERIEQLVVVDIAPKDYYWVAHRKEFAAMTELDLGNLSSRAEAEMRFESRVSNLSMRKFLATNLGRDEQGRWRWIINLSVLTAALPVMEKNSLTATDCFMGPALFIAGGKSSYVPLEAHADILRHFPAANIETIPDSCHNPHMEARAEFVRLLLKYR